MTRAFVGYLLARPFWRRYTVMLLALAAFCAAPVRYAWLLLAAEPVTVSITGCPGPAARWQPTTCEGRWTLPDGTAGAGRVDGAFAGTGVALPGWATVDHATTDREAWLLYPLAGLALLAVAGAAVGVTWWRWWLAVRPPLTS